LVEDFGCWLRRKKRDSNRALYREVVRSDDGRGLVRVERESKSVGWERRTEG
jgi:hypothetical protein